MVRMPDKRSEALLDLLLEAVAEEGAAPFPAHVLAGLRRAVPCEAVSYHEWSPQELLEFSLVADEPETWLPVWRSVSTCQTRRSAGGWSPADRVSEPAARPGMAPAGPCRLRRPGGSPGSPPGAL